MKAMNPVFYPVFILLNNLYISLVCLFNKKTIFLNNGFLY